MILNLKKQLILASASPRRVALLQQVGIIPDMVVPADIDESQIRGELAREYCGRLAEKKAITIGEKNPNSIVIAADSTVAMGRRIFGKPYDAAEAIQTFKLLSGRRHRVITAVHVYSSDVNGLKNFSKRKISETMVQFKVLTEKEIVALIESNEWRDKCGGYTISGMASAFIKRIDGTPSNVLGLPLYETYSLLLNAQ